MFGIIIALCVFLGIPVYCHYNAKIFCGTNKIYLVLFLETFWIFFVKLCLLAVLSAESVKGQKKA